VSTAPGRLVVPEPGGDSPAEIPGREASLVERYREMAHTFESRPADLVIRAVDVVLAALLLTILSPLLALCALAVLASGGRPVLYRGARVGRAGRVFQMYKLRTLRVDAEQRLGPYLGEELSRLTAHELTVAGRVLRAAKLDELPQLWNVLRGDMSLVGPRPIRPAFFVELCEAIPAYWQRLVVRPGMTGLAQLRLPREMTWAEKLAHDIEFIADRSMRLYVSVLWQTVIMLLRRALRRRNGA
jgi:lipopolysaccharide/colanic/teichoic acid biosynthesis glycosyltransferase